MLQTLNRISHDVTELEMFRSILTLILKNEFWTYHSLYSRYGFVVDQLTDDMKLKLLCLF